MIQWPRVENQIFHTFPSLFFCTDLERIRIVYEKWFKKSHIIVFGDFRPLFNEWFCVHGFRDRELLYYVVFDRPRRKMIAIRK